MLAKIIDKGNIEDMYKLNDMLDNLICDLKEQKPKLYKEYKKELYELAYGNVILEDKAIEIVKNMKPNGEHYSLEYAKDIKADVIIGGESKISIALKMKEYGVSLIEVGHYESEIICQLL